MNVLVGHTGFVGNNLYRYGSFELGVNSGSVREAYGTKPDSVSMPDCGRKNTWRISSRKKIGR